MELGESSWAWTMAKCWSFVKFSGLDHDQVMELGENSLSWTMARRWSLVKIHGLGPWRGDEVWWKFMGCGLRVGMEVEVVRRFSR